MIRERSNLVSDGTVDGTYCTIVCPMCLDDIRTKQDKPPVVEVVTPPPPAEPETPLLDYQRFLFGRKSRKS